MRYILAPDTFLHPNLSQNQPLQFVPYKVHRVGDSWFIVSPNTKGWCMLSDQEYAVYQKLAAELCYIIRNEPETKEKDEFVVALTQCGLAEPVSGEANTSPSTHNCAPSFFLTLILSEYCNLACRYCYLDMGDSMRRGYLDVTIAREVIRNVFDMPHKHIVIDFGEIGPSLLLFQKLVSFAETMQRERPDKVMTLAIQTNGINLKPRVLDYLDHHKVFVGISIDGPRQFHDRVRISSSGHGSHFRAEAALQEIIKRGMPHIVLCTISSANVSYPEEIINYFLRLGVSQFAFKPLIKRGKALEEWQILSVTESEYKEFLRSVIDYAIEHRTWKALDLYLTQHLFRLMRDPRGWVNRCPGTQCGAGRDMLVINPYGDFFPCPRLTSLERNSLYLGSTFTDAIRAGMSLALGSFLEEQCANCVWSACCEGPCRLSAQLYDITTMAAGFSCDVQQHIYELLVGRLIPATDVINAVSGPGIGQFKLIKRDFFNSSLARRGEVG
jgi:radical SAM protein with 4Fe4S-binding SPASM domain